MLKTRALLLAILLVVVPFGLFGASSKANPESEQAKEKLDKLQKKFPQLIHKWAEQAEDKLKGGKLKSELKMLRWIGPTEVKITYACSFDVEGIQGSWTMSFYLRYYDGKWTTTDFCTDHPNLPFADLMLLIDQAE
ncbi:hypothetical protein [Frigoriglobus tundricola]|uniref:Uncharacterized protein n=1 Tax=Frigoriglobus tundricola TaxID=2774151 RepID=A0A6M5YP07_9BACT|nr:hypothetical protein [Frigoriglobus tundricola]QJW95066.1 hypothetical protein FTUN_2592 [Frigoriglobus tundricola]